jgi:hypothetical protein
VSPHDRAEARSTGVEASASAAVARGIHGRISLSPPLPSVAACRRRRFACCCLHPRARRLCGETEEASAPVRTGQATATALIRRIDEKG